MPEKQDPPPMLAAFLNVSLLRANPQDLPASHTVLAAALAAHFIVDVLNALVVVPWGAAIQAGAVSTVLLIAVTHTALLLRNLKERAVQTLSALAGCAALIDLIKYIALRLLVGDVSPGGVAQQGDLSPLLVAVPFEIWLIVVYGHIVRHAFAIRLALGVLFSLVYLTLASLIVMAFLVPIPD
jgi:hypothetical protein